MIDKFPSNTSEELLYFLENVKNADKANASHLNDVIPDWSRSKEFNF